MASYQKMRVADLRKVDASKLKEDEVDTAIRKMLDRFSSVPDGVGFNVTKEVAERIAAVSKPVATPVPATKPVEAK